MGSGTSRLFSRGKRVKPADAEAERLQQKLAEKELELQEANRQLQQYQSHTLKDPEMERLQRLLEEREQALNKAQEQLDEYRSKLSAMEMQSGSPERAPPTKEAPKSPFTPTRINTRNPHGPIRRLIIHHDGENCYIPNDDRLTFGPVRAALAAITLTCTQDSHTPEDLNRLLDNMEYYFYITNWDKKSRFHPAISYWNDMDALGVHLEGVGTKKGSVDTKMKAHLNRLAHRHRDAAAAT